MLKIILTGGSGFLGSHLLEHMAFSDALVIGRTRPTHCRNFRSLSFDASTSFTELIDGFDVVVHTAGRAHIMKEKCNNPLDEYRKINTLVTLNLAKQAAQAGIKRFIFISSIKVLGESTDLDVPFINSDGLNPQDPYSVSKAEAEVGLKKIAEASGMDLVIIRPPLIYGKGVKGNFLSRMKLATLPLPLPLGDIKNRRSLVSAENLVDLIVTCIEHPNARNKSFLVSDDRDVTTPELFSMLSVTGGFTPWIFRCPQILLSLCLSLVGKSAIFDRLCGSMQVNIDYTKSELSWYPPSKIESSLAKCWSKVN